MPLPAQLTPATFVAIVAACSVGAGPETRLLALGDTIPEQGLLGNRPALVWVFDAAECLGCGLTGPARTVRLLQRRLGNRMETVVAAVSEMGAEDRAMVTSFLESQRVSANVRMRAPREHVRAFGSAPVPAFYIVDKNRVVQAVLEPDRADSWHSTDDSLKLADFVEALAEEVEVPKEMSRQ